jgi:acyl-CoA hydrolase
MLRLFANYRPPNRFTRLIQTGLCVSSKRPLKKAIPFSSTVISSSNGMHPLGPDNTINPGTLASYLDTSAAITASKFCGNPYDSRVTVSLKLFPVENTAQSLPLASIVNSTCRVVAVGNSSIDVDGVISGSPLKKITGASHEYAPLALGKLSFVNIEPAGAGKIITKPVPHGLKDGFHILPPGDLVYRHQKLAIAPGPTYFETNDLGYPMQTNSSGIYIFGGFLVAKANACFSVTAQKTFSSDAYKTVFASISFLNSVRPKHNITFKTSLLGSFGNRIFSFGVIGTTTPMGLDTEEELFLTGVFLAEKPTFSSVWSLPFKSPDWDFLSSQTMREYEAYMNMPLKETVNRIIAE